MSGLIPFKLHSLDTPTGLLKNISYVLVRPLHVVCNASFSAASSLNINVFCILNILKQILRSFQGLSVSLSESDINYGHVAIYSPSVLE